MIVALSPHLDDAVFSCGGYLADHPDPERLIITVFTRSVSDPTGFALACQTDKGLAADVDYMAVRREEDRAAAALLGCRTEHWDFAEAPHRGYDSAAELFGGPHEDDADIVPALSAKLGDRLAALRPDEILYPVGVGDHVDHLQLIAAVDEVRQKGLPKETRWKRYYDQPYTVKSGVNTGAATTFGLSPAQLTRKVTACEAYATQVGFQFGGKVREVLGRWEYYR